MIGKDPSEASLANPEQLNLDYLKMQHQIASINGTYGNS